MCLLWKPLWALAGYTGPYCSAEVDAAFYHFTISMCACFCVFLCDLRPVCCSDPWSNSRCQVCQSFHWSSLDVWGLHVATSRRTEEGTNHCKLFSSLNMSVLDHTFKLLPACFDTVGWVIWPAKTRPWYTYSVFGVTLNLSQLQLNSTPAILDWCNFNRLHYLFCSSDRPSIRFPALSRPLTCISRDTISLYLVEGFRLNLAQIFIMRNGHCWKGFPRSEVKGQGHDQTECYSGGGMRFDSVALRHTCLLELSG